MNYLRLFGACFTFSFVLYGMEKTQQALPVLPKELMSSIMQYLEVNSATLNFLVRIYGLPPALAQKIVGEFLKKIPYYPANNQRIQTLLKLYFATFRSLVKDKAQKALASALKEHSTAHPLRTALHQKDFDILSKTFSYIATDLFNHNNLNVPYTHEEALKIRSALTSIYPSFSYEEKASEEFSKPELIQFKQDFLHLKQELQICSHTLKTWQQAYKTKRLYTFLPFFLIPPLLLVTGLAIYSYWDKLPPAHSFIFIGGISLVVASVCTAFYSGKLTQHNFISGFCTILSLILLRAYCFDQFRPHNLDLSNRANFDLLIQQTREFNFTTLLGSGLVLYGLLITPLILDFIQRKALRAPRLLNDLDPQGYPALLRSIDMLIEELPEAQVRIEEALKQAEPTKTY